jgi:two-component system, sensor histidine kinase
MHDSTETHVRVGNFPLGPTPPRGSFNTASRKAAARRRPGRLPFPDDSLPLEIKSPRAIQTPLFPKEDWPPLMADDRHGNRVTRNGVVGRVVLEITRQHELTQAQIRVQELTAANRRKDEFLAILSHELRSPLSSMRYALCLLSKQTDEADAQKRTQELMARQLGRLTRLVDGLLDVSRITNRRLRLKLVRMDLRAIVTGSIETLQSDFHVRDQRLSIEFPTTPVWVQADACRLEQVFVNLLANASRYTDSGGTVKVRMQTSEGHAVVHIRDSGIGIAPDALMHIFELFSQANSDARSSTGLGVGLAVVRELVELHEGRVIAASPGLGQGSEFSVHLPSAAPVVAALST